MKNTFFVILFFLVNTAIYPQHATWLTGKWKGNGYQPDAATQTSWSMMVKYNGEKLVVQYPSLKCGGTWQFQQETGHRAEFTEHITFGKENCIEGCKVVVQLMDNNYCSIEFYSYGQLIATGKIQKERP